MYTSARSVFAAHLVGLPMSAWLSGNAFCAYSRSLTIRLYTSSAELRGTSLIVRLFSSRMSTPTQLRTRWKYAYDLKYLASEIIFDLTAALSSAAIVAFCITRLAFRILRYMKFHESDARLILDALRQEK